MLSVECDIDLSIHLIVISRVAKQVAVERRKRLEEALYASSA